MFSEKVVCKFAFFIKSRRIFTCFNLQHLEQILIKRNLKSNQIMSYQKLYEWKTFWFSTVLTMKGNFILKLNAQPNRHRASRTLCFCDTPKGDNLTPKAFSSNKQFYLPKSISDLGSTFAGACSLSLSHSLCNKKLFLLSRIFSPLRTSWRQTSRRFFEPQKGQLPLARFLHRPEQWVFGHE